MTNNSTDISTSFYNFDENEPYFCPLKYFVWNKIYTTIIEKQQLFILTSSSFKDWSIFVPPFYWILLKNITFCAFLITLTRTQIQKKPRWSSTTDFLLRIISIWLPCLTFLIPTSSTSIEIIIIARASSWEKETMEVFSWRTKYHFSKIAGQMTNKLFFLRKLLAACFRYIFG